MKNLEQQIFETTPADNKLSKAEEHLERVQARASEVSARQAELENNKSTAAMEEKAELEKFKKLLL